MFHSVLTFQNQRPLPVRIFECQLACDSRQLAFQCGAVLIESSSLSRTDAACQLKLLKFVTQRFFNDSLRQVALGEIIPGAWCFARLLEQFEKLVRTRLDVENA